VYGVRYAWWLRLNPLGGVLIPIGKLVVSFILLNSAVQTWRRRGVHWRGTHYSLDELRDGHRVRRQ